MTTTLPSHPPNDDDAIHRYGQKFIQETPELIQRKLQELDEELERIPHSQRIWYTTALDRAPKECNDAFKLKHLRCEVFRVQDASKRIISYWNKRVELFGEEKAFQPLTLSSPALSDDSISIDIGFVRPTLQTDDGGRSILFMDPSRVPIRKHTDDDERSMTRAFWYYLHAVLEEEDVQRRGVVILVHPKNATMKHFDRKLSQAQMASLRGCIPVRVAAIHICHPPFFFGVVFSVVKVFLGQVLRKRIQLHSGGVEEVLDKLQKKYGIDMNKVPTEMGGRLELDHKAWLENRKRMGL